MILGIILFIIGMELIIIGPVLFICFLERTIKNFLKYTILCNILYIFLGILYGIFMIAEWIMKKGLN